MRMEIDKVKLAQLPTPISYLRDYAEGLSIAIKRDDLTHFLASGNKIRKLEYLFYEALQQNCTHVVTCGGIQSNHCRATAVLCRELELKPVLFLRGQKPTFPEGNLLIDALADSEIHWITSDQYEKRDTLMEEYRLQQSDPNSVYIIPEGGSTALGAIGYSKAVKELSKQVDMEQYEGLFTAVGSGGTYAGLFAGMQTEEFPIPVYGINVTKTPKEKFTARIIAILEEMKEKYKIPLQQGFESSISIFDDYVGDGYAIPTDEGMKHIRSLMSLKAILLDPVYTAKAFSGMLDISRKKGLKRVLFWHTGGGFSLFACADKVFKGV